MKQAASESVKYGNLFLVWKIHRGTTALAVQNDSTTALFQNDVHFACAEPNA